MLHSILSFWMRISSVIYVASTVLNRCVFCKCLKNALCMRQLLLQLGNAWYLRYPSKAPSQERLSQCCVRWHVKWTSGRINIVKGKSKVVPTLFLSLSTTPWRRIGGVVVYCHSFFDRVTRWGEWSALNLYSLTPRGRAPGTYWIGGCVDPRAVMDAVVKRKIPSSCRESNPRTPIVQPVS
jgi:hypothetical protein